MAKEYHDHLLNTTMTSKITNNFLGQTEDMYIQQRVILIEMEESLAQETVKEEAKLNGGHSTAAGATSSRFSIFRENTRNDLSRSLH